MARMLNEGREPVRRLSARTARWETLGVLADDRWLPATDLVPVEIERIGRLANVCVVEPAPVLA